MSRKGKTQSADFKVKFIIKLLENGKTLKRQIEIYYQINATILKNITISNIDDWNKKDLKVVLIKGDITP